MKEVFGIPVDTLLVGLLVGLGISLCALAARPSEPNPREARSSSVGRRRGRSALIVVGLMLGTTIIAAALTTGDTMSHTIKATTVSTLERPTRPSPRGRRGRHPGRTRRRDRNRLGRRVGGEPHRVGRGAVRPRRRDHGRDRRPGGCPGARLPVRASRASSSSPATRPGWTGSRRSEALPEPRCRSPTCVRARSI